MKLLFPEEMFNPPVKSVRLPRVCRIRLRSSARRSSEDRSIPLSSGKGHSSVHDTGKTCSVHSPPGIATFSAKLERLASSSSQRMSLLRAPGASWYAEFSKMPRRNSSLSGNLVLSPDRLSKNSTNAATDGPASTNRCEMDWKIRLRFLGCQSTQGSPNDVGINQPGYFLSVRLARRLRLQSATRLGTLW